MTPPHLAPMLIAAILAVPGCAATAPPLGDGRSAAPAQGEIPVLVAGPVSRAWSSATVPLAGGGAVAAVTSGETLSLWRIGPDRTATRLGDDTEAGFHPDAALAYDWDGDGTKEVLVAGEGSNTIQLWKATGELLSRSGSFPAKQPMHLDVADIDGDGLPDIVTGPYSGNQVSVFWGRGGFDFERMDLDAGAGPNYPVIVDWDGDGRPDIAWADRYQGTLRVARNLGNRRFAVEVLHDATARAAPRIVIPSDVNNDGNTDLIVTLEVGKGALALLGDGEGGVERIETIPSPGSGFRFGAADTDGGQLALTVSDNGRIVLARRGMGGEWELRWLPYPTTSVGLRFDDVDGDGTVDLVAHSIAKKGDNGLVVFWGPLWERAQPVEMPAGQ